jgi:hypothetical protein
MRTVSEEPSSPLPTTEAIGMIDIGALVTSDALVGGREASDGGTGSSMR